MARHTQKFVSYLPSTAPQDKTRGLQMIIIDFFLKKKQKTKKTFPFNYVQKNLHQRKHKKLDKVKLS